MMVMDRDADAAVTVLTRTPLAMNHQNAAGDPYGWNEQQDHHSP